MYANTLLGTLNTRKLRERKHNSSSSYSLPVIFSDNFPGKSSPDNHTSRRGDGRHYVSEVCLTWGSADWPSGYTLLALISMCLEIMVACIRMKC